MAGGRSILLASLSFETDKTGTHNILLSPSLKHILLIYHNKVTLYALAKHCDYEHKATSVIWTNTFSQVESFLFSDDGKQFAVINGQQPRKINLYNITEQAVTEESETCIKDIGQTTSAAPKTVENVCDSSAVTSAPVIRLIYLHKSQIIVYNSGSLVSFRLSSTECQQNYYVSLPPETLLFHFNINFFGSLDQSGIIYFYLLESGNVIGTFDIYKALPRSLRFSRFCMNTTASQVALVETSNQVYILDVTLSMTATTFPFLQQSSPHGSSTSVSSFKTSTSKTSSYSRSESLRKEVTSKKIASIANASSANNSWLSYLEKLTKRRKKSMGYVEEAGAYVCIRDIPSVYSIQSLHFCQDSLGIWGVHPDETSDGFYRVYDKTSGQLESVDILAPDTQVIPLESLSVSLDLFLQASNLCLPLGVISRDTLIQKMVGGESEGVVDEMIGHAVLPLPLLQEGLFHHQLDMVRLALNLHTQGFKSKVREEEVADELTESTRQLFEALQTAVGVWEADSSGQWNQQVRRLALTHANILLSLLMTPAAQASLQVQILRHVVVLRRNENSISVDPPIVPQWTSWLYLSDDEVALHAISSLPLVQCFLAIHRGWTESDLEGDRFYNTVQRVITSLLQQRDVEKATEFLVKVNLNPEEELRALCLRCQDCSLRDFLVADKRTKLDGDQYEAWQFLTLMESVLTHHSHIFPTFTESPLKILDVLTFSENDKSNILLDLYFATWDSKLEVHLDKNACWDFLLTHNYTEGILRWLGSGSSSSDFAWPLQLFSQWTIDKAMVERVLSSDCMELTKHLVCNSLATRGVLTEVEKASPAKLITRFSLAEVFPKVREILNQDSATLSNSQFTDIMLQHAMKNNLVSLAVQSDFSGVVFDDSGPDWLRLYKLHTQAGETWELSDISQAVQETTKYLAALDSVDLNLYLKQHPLVAVVTDILNNQDVCKRHCHVSPLLAASVPVNQPPQDDISLYSVLSHTVPFHTDNIFQHQISSKRNSRLPDFSSENLSLRYGFDFSVGFKEFLKQGRPGSAVSSIMQKGKFSSRRKTAVSCAHGLALRYCDNSTIATACITFTELLGHDSTLLRVHIATARQLLGHIDEKKLKEHLLHLVQNREGSAANLLFELEDFLTNKWKTECSSLLTCLQDFHLAVRLSVCHNLPAPLALFNYSLETKNWVLFVLAAQLFQYSVSRVQESITSVENEVSKYLYYALHSNKHTGSNQSESTMTKPFGPKTNLFACLAEVGNSVGTLLQLSRELNSPALALLASSLQAVPVETALSSWLVASLSPQEANSAPSPPWNTSSITQLLELLVRQGYFYTLSHGFFIFQPMNPFCALATFFIESVVEKKFKESVLNLKLFIAAFFNLPKEDKKESSFIMNKSWVAFTAYRLACTALVYCFPSEHHKRCFLKTLCDAQFSDVFQGGQSLPLLLRLSECLADTSLELDWKRLCLQDDTSQLSELLSNLTEQHLFDTAFRFAHIVGLPTSHVLVTQWTALSLSDERKERDFWLRCETAFEQGNIDPEVAITFYRDLAAESEELEERYVLLKFALDWMNKTSCKADDMTPLQAELYMTCLQEKFKSEVITEGLLPSPFHCLSEELVLKPVRNPPQLCSSQYHRLDDIIHQLLVVGDIQIAFQLQALFNHTNQDCELLLASMRLAEGVTSVSQLPARIQEYLVDETVRRPKMVFTSPLPRLRSQQSLMQSDSQAILNALYALQAHQTCATALFSNVICGFKVSVALGCDYKDVILDLEPLNRLQTQHEFEVATCLLSLASLTRSECSQFLCSQLVTVLTFPPEDGKYSLWGCDLETEFSLILDLSGSPLLLGNLLLASDPPLDSSSELSTFRQVVELLILAHHCFTRVCHMEGIASVLNLSRSIVNRLLDCCHWPLMVRLLTGIGRYTEMKYIFQILKENNQFEFLLGKGLDKPQLMSATLEFVRCDKELFSLVAHHFSMYSELAGLYEEEARQEAARVEVVDGRLSVSAHNKSCLKAAMSKYTDATEHYMQAKKMKCGVSSVQQAELMAVQLALLVNATEPTVPCLINLTNPQALELVNTFLSCEQAHIVASAYGVAVDWSAALYYNCVVRGDTSYLNTWTRHHQLTQTVVQDVVRRFQNERETNSTMEVNMKWFVSSVSLLDVKYRVASQLGFKDILQNLLSSPDMAYLKDTVWQSGFKKQMF